VKTAFQPEKRSTDTNSIKSRKSRLDEDETLKIQVVTAGALTHSLPIGKVVIEGEGLTVRGLIESLIARYGSRMAEELVNQGELRDGLVLMVNGRNVLSLPATFETPLMEGDEVLITITVAGG